MAEVEILNTTDDVAATEHEVSKRGLPKWLVLLPIVLVLGLFVAMRGDRSVDSALTTVPDPVDSDADASVGGAEASQTQADDGGGGSFGNLRVRGNESERLGLIHGTHRYSKSVPEGAAGLGDRHVIALRAGADLLVIDSVEPHAHRIQLPRGSSPAESDDSSIALVLDKLIVADGPLLRSLSVQGGVDLILATGLAGFQVDGTRLVVAAETTDVRFETKKVIDLRVQGVHADFFGVPERTRVPDGGHIVQKDGRVFVEIGGQVFVPFDAGLVSLYPGTVVAAGPNHALIQDCSGSERNTESISCQAVRARFDGTEVAFFEEPGAFGAADFVLAADGEQLFVVDDGSANQRLLKLVDGTWEESQVFETSRVDAAAFSGDSATLVTVSDNNINFWRNGALVETWQLDEFPAVTEVTVGG